MKRSLLELTNDILSSIDSETVDTISDTQEADQVVKIYNRAYEDMITAKRWRHLKRLVNFISSSELNELVAPTNTMAIDPYNFYYNGVLMQYYKPEVFFSMTTFRTGTNLTVMDNINVYNDQNPTFFTSVDDETLKFDSVPDDLNGLQASLSQGFIYTTPERLVSGEEFFELPGQAYPALTKLALAYAYGELKGDDTQAARYEKQYVKHMSQLERTGRYIDKLDDLRDNIITRPTRNYQSTKVVAN